MFKFNGFTEKANKVLNLAVASAQQLGHTYIGSEHLLLGILEEGTGCRPSSARGSLPPFLPTILPPAASGFWKWPSPPPGVWATIT